MIQNVILLFLLAASGATGPATAPAPSPPPATAPAPAALPTCAVLVDAPAADPVRDIAALLEAQLSASGKVRLLDRVTVEKVLGEQKLQLLLGSESGTDRVRIGQLLKAQSLILLRHGSPTPAGQPTMDVLVSETGRGLRLLNQHVTIPAQGGTDIEALGGMVLPPVLRSLRAITHVSAVLPFVDNDLTGEFDLSRGSYQRVVEQVLARDPSLAVLDVEEADHVAQELKLAGEKQLAAHQAPLYFAGEFRDEGKGEKRRVQLKLAARLSGRVIHQVDTLVPPEHVAQLITLTVQDAMEKAFGHPLPAGDPAAEVAQLDERAEVFRRLGNWGEAASLYNASLLVEYDQETAHSGLIQVTTHLAGDPYGGRTLAAPERAAARQRAWEYWRQGREHLEWLIAHDKAFSADAARPSKRLWYKNLLGDYLFNSVAAITDDNPKVALGDTTIDFHDLYAARRAIRDDMIDSLGHFVPGRRHALGEVVVGLLDRGPVAFDESTRDYAEAVEKTIRHAAAMESIGDFAWNATGWLRDPAHRIDDKAPPEFTSLVGRLKADADPRLSAAGRFIQDNLDGKAVVPSTLETTQLGEGRGWGDALGPTVRVEPLKLDMPRQRSDGPPLQVDPWGWVDGGAARDIIYDRHTLCVMTFPGKLEVIYRDDAPPDSAPWSAADSGIQWPCCDGPHIWVPHPGPQPLLLMFDTTTGDRYRFGASDGLPPMDRAASSAALGPGRILLSGAFVDEDHKTKAWIGVVTLRRHHHITVDVFHEAKDASTSGRRMAADLAFRPARMIVLGDPAKPGNQRVLIGRLAGENDNALEVLEVNPLKRSVDVRRDHINPADFTLTQSPPGIDDGVMYYGRSAGNDGFAYHPWFRFGFPDLQATEVRDDVGNTMQARFVNGRAVALDGRGRWWLAKSMGGPFVRLGSPPLPPNDQPGLAPRELIVSHTLGLILLNPTATGREVLRVTPPVLSDEQIDALYERQLRCIPENAQVYQGRAFWALPGAFTFAQARGEAQRRGARLMRIDGPQDSGLFNKMVHQNHRPPFWWIGMRSDGVRREFLDGTPATFAPFDAKLTPRSALEGVLAREGTWSIGTPTDRAGCVLEWDVQPATQPGGVTRFSGR